MKPPTSATDPTDGASYTAPTSSCSSPRTSRANGCTTIRSGAPAGSRPMPGRPPGAFRTNYRPSQRSWAVMTNSARSSIMHSSRLRRRISCSATDKVTSATPTSRDAPTHTYSAGAGNPGSRNTGFAG